MTEKQADLHSVFMSVYGIAKFDVQAVANAVRNRTLTSMEAWGLANLLEGKHPDGLFLKLHGQGNAETIQEGAIHYQRILSIGRQFYGKMAVGDTEEGAVNEIADELNLSEATVRRDLRIYRLTDDYHELKPVIK